MKMISWEELISTYPPYVPEIPPHCSKCGRFVRYDSVAMHSDVDEAYCDHCGDWRFVSYERA